MRAVPRILRTPLLGGMIGVLAALGLVAGFSAGVRPAGAQFFFDDRYPFLERRRQQYNRDYRYRDPFRDFYREREPVRQAPVDHSRAPPPSRKSSDEPPAKTVLVLGDSLADWLAYGLEDAFSETPEISVVRKHQTVSGLIHGEARADSYDWVQSARDIVAAEKADYVVMMIGLGDRQAIRERPARPQPQPAAPGRAAQPGSAQPGQPAGSPAAGQSQAGQPAAGQPAAAGAQQAKEAVPAQQPPADAEAKEADAPSIVAPEPAAAAKLRTHEFRSERWAELYAKRIEDTVAAMKSKGVPVYWVGLPAIRGSRSSADMAYLNDLFRGHAERAGAIFVDVWDGFVDEAGNFAVHGPDLAGQRRRLRAGDGVHFTKAGARKLAHYVEREIQRSLLARPMPVSLPAQDEAAEAPAKPGAPASRPAAGPIVYLTGATAGGGELLGAAAARPTKSDQAATRVLLKGEAVEAPAGRVDDFAWPRRQIATTSVTNIAEPAVPAPPGSTPTADAASAQPAGARPAPGPQPPAQRTAQPAPRTLPQRSSPSFFFWPFGR